MMSLSNVTLYSVHANYKYHCKIDYINFNQNYERKTNPRRRETDETGHLKTGMFKWTPDVDSAIECFDKGF